MRSRPFDLTTVSLALAAVLIPLAAGAQQATVSPFLERILSRDTIVTVWLFARPERSLDDVIGLVTQAGGRVRRSSQWLHAVSANLTTGALRTMRRRPELQRIQPVARFVRAPEPTVQAMLPQAAPPFPAPDADDFGPSIMPIRRLNLLPLVNRGFRGQGVRIAILDTGFETGLPVFASTVVLAQRDFIRDDGVVRNEAGDPSGQSDHGTSTWSLLGGNLQGTLVGIAPAAEYILAKTEDTSREVQIEEDDYVAALEWADSLNADIVSSSLGYFGFDGGFTYTTAQLNGDVAVTTMAVDIAAQRGITVVTSAGNNGPGTQTLGTPADADSAIAVGAVDSLGNLVGFSSRGPTADGRIKPDVTAPGSFVWVATANGTFGRGSGTSFSAPIVAGAAALLKQMFPAFGPIDIRDALRSAGSHVRAPDSNNGWGTPDVSGAAWIRLETFNTPGNTNIMSTQPAFAWISPATSAGLGPFRYDLRVLRASSGFVQLAVQDIGATTLVSPSPLPYNVPFRWIITARLGADSAAVSSAGTFTVIEENIPAVTLLFQTFPNPFPDRGTDRRATCIWFDLATAGKVRLDILDQRGHLVRNLVPGSTFDADLPAGHYGRAGSGSGCDPAFEWNGMSANGLVVSQGIYLARLTTPDGTFFKRIVYLGPGI